MFFTSRSPSGLLVFTSLSSGPFLVLFTKFTSIYGAMVALAGSLNGLHSMWKKKSNKAKPASSFTRPNVSFADAVKVTPLTGANRVPLHEQSLRKSVFDRLLFQTFKI